MGRGKGWEMGRAGGTPRGLGLMQMLWASRPGLTQLCTPKQATFFLQTCFLLCELGFEKYCPALLPRLRVVGTQSFWLRGPEVWREHAFWSQAV